MPSRVDKKERRKLKIIWVLPEPEKFGDTGLKLKFNTEDNLQFETFSKTLFPLIVVGAELDCDTELQISTGRDGREYSHWIVTQIYKDGEPVVQKKAYSGTFKKTSDESIERQVAVKEIGLDLRSGIDVPQDLIDLRQTWLRGTFVAKPSTPSKPTSEPIKPPQQSSQDISKDWLIENLEQLGKVNPLAYQNLMLNLKKKGYVEGGSVSDFILNQPKAKDMAEYIKGKLNE